MRNVVLYIAMSLDGYIADSAGGVDWLTGQDSSAEAEDSYGAFEQGIDTVIMGWRTYHQIITELSPGHWVYESLKSYVITHRNLPSTDRIIFTSQEPCGLVEKLRANPGRDIWICGGAELAGQLMGGDQIDTYHISVIPVILGRGIRLFPELDRSCRLRLVSSRSCNGILELVYRRQ